MKPLSDVDEYIANAPGEWQGRLKEVRNAIKSVAPAALERISYGMPFYEYKGRLVYFALAKRHIGIYAIFEPVRAQFKKELEGKVMSKGTIQFPLSEKLPVSLIKKLVKAQMKENEKAQKQK